MENPGEIYSPVELGTPGRELKTHPSYSPGSLETGGSLGRFKISLNEPEGGRGMGKIKLGIYFTQKHISGTSRRHQKVGFPIDIYFF